MHVIERLVWHYIRAQSRYGISILTVEETFALRDKAFNIGPLPDLPLNRARYRVSHEFDETGHLGFIWVTLVSGRVARVHLTHLFLVLGKLALF